MRLLFAVCTLIVAGSGLLACDCIPNPPPKKALEASAAVCLAEVVKIEEVDQQKMVTLKVEKWWKGGEKAELVVLTSKSGASCGYHFEKGKTYLVYARAGEKDKPMHVSLCSRTRTKDEADKSGDFKELGEGKAAKKE